MANIQDFDFAEAFDDIDLNRDGTIHTSSLRRWMQRQGVEEKSVQTVLQGLDPEATNQITRDAFQEYLGHLKITYTIAVDPNEALGEDVKEIASDMSLGMKRCVVRIVTNIWQKSQTNKDATRMIKKRLDSALDSLWHVVAIKGQYWAYYSNEPQTSIAFSYNGYIFLIWKTPGA